MSEPFILGVNYWPRRKAMYWWSDFDPAEVDDEFAVIREIGLDVVRIFLLWDDFQPEPDGVSINALQHLEHVCDIAERHGLRIDLTFFTGHMSGPNWTPGWLRGGPLPPHNWIRQVVSDGRLIKNGYRNMFHDPVALSASTLLLETVVKWLQAHPAIWMWNLGNEPDLFAWPNTPKAGQEWVREMTMRIKAIDPTHPVTCGLHAASLHENNGLEIHRVYAETDKAVMHAYPMYVDYARSPLDPDFVPFTTALTASLCGKPVLMEEFGGCTAPPGKDSYTWKWKASGLQRTQFMASEEDLAEYFRQVLPRLVEVGATGAMTWCFADYAKELWDRPPCNSAKHERFFGLVRPDGSLKPHAEVIKAFAQTKPQVQPIPAWARLNVNPEEFYKYPDQNTRALYPQYLHAKENASPDTDGFEEKS